jgi:phosphomannomutase
VSDQLSARFSDVDGIRAAMSRLRAAPPRSLAGAGVSQVRDLSAGIDGLPPTDGVVLVAGDGTRVIVRPSGTEPKIKCYLEVIERVAPDASSLAVGKARIAAHAKLEKVKAEMRRVLGF